MYLSRVTVTGFKSFAGKTVIDLERGITAIVGPNGSGKSNLADAVRWALGEQGKNRLRLEGGREEVVFAGNDTKPRASYAEVVLLFDNEDGAFPLDLTQVEIARRMYRSGETDYRLAGRSVRLSDIQSLLAQAGVGANTYAVIGQGMIDNMLMSTPAERKLLFDEAAGIRGPELGREAALRRLNATAANLTRLRDIAGELAPRLGSLETTVGAAGERERLEAEVAALRAAVSAAAYAHWNSAAAAAASGLEGAAQGAHNLRHERHALEQAGRRAERAEAQAAQRLVRLQSHLSALEQSRDRSAAALHEAQSAVSAAVRDAEMAKQASSRLTHAATELAEAQERLTDLRAELAGNAEATARARAAVDAAGKSVAAAQAALIAVRKDAGSDARDAYLHNALHILKTLAAGLGTPQLDHSQVKLLVHKAGRLLSHATRISSDGLAAELGTSQKRLEAAMTKRDTAVEHQTNLAIAGSSLEIDLAYQLSQVERLEARLGELKSELTPLKRAAESLPRLRTREAQAAAKLQSDTAALDAERAQLPNLSDQSAAIAEGSRRLADLERIKTQLQTLAESQSALRTARTTAARELAAVTRQAIAWGISPEAAPATATGPDQPQFQSASLPDLTDRLARAEALLEARTQVYQEQLAQYQEVTARDAELAAQIADLERAESDLLTLVSRLDATIKTRFHDNFSRLAEQFSAYFTRLFEGGNASLELTESEDGTYGINIKASPKGKRLATIAALSGGERALAGVALIAAIMKVNPSPFVVLDEIDAALDEANSGRLATILGELEQFSQLIVITHNRQTMQAAKTLFGVTMGEHHTSHLISMRLEQATRLAAR